MYKVSIALPTYIDLTLPLESTDIYFPGVSKIAVFSSLHAKVQSHTIVTFIVTKHSPKTAAVGPLIVTYIMCSALGLKSNTCICFVQRILYTNMFCCKFQLCKGLTD